MRWTKDQYDAYQRKRVQAGGAVPNAQPERDQAPALERAVSGEAASLPRIVVRFIGYRVKPLDPDNFAGSTKDLIDGLRHASIIPGDEPWRIRLETEQVKVRSYKEECTVIEIMPTPALCAPDTAAQFP